MSPTVRRAKDGTPALNAPNDLVLKWSPAEELAYNNPGVEGDTGEEPDAKRSYDDFDTVHQSFGPPGASDQ